MSDLEVWPTWFPCVQITTPHLLFSALGSMDGLRRLLSDEQLGTGLRSALASRGLQAPLYHGMWWISHEVKDFNQHDQHLVGVLVLWFNEFPSGDLMSTLHHFTMATMARLKIIYLSRKLIQSVSGYPRVWASGAQCLPSTAGLRWLWWSSEPPFLAVTWETMPCFGPWETSVTESTTREDARGRMYIIDCNI